MVPCYSMGRAWVLTKVVEDDYAGMISYTESEGYIRFSVFEMDKVKASPMLLNSPPTSDSEVRDMITERYHKGRDFSHTVE